MAVKTSFLLLVYRNVIASLDKGYLIWQVAFFPILYIYLAGFCYSAFIGGREVLVGNSEFVSYTAYLTAGMMAFNVMNISTVSGSIIWEDKRNGMFQQLLMMPFTRNQYLNANVLLIILMGFGSAFLVALAGIPHLIGNANPTLLTLPYTAYALLTGSIFFGSIVVVLASKFRSKDGFNVIVNTIFLFSAWASPAFYPTQQIPDIIMTAFYLNPITYVVDLTRAGIFSEVDGLTNLKMLIMGVLSTSAFLIAKEVVDRMRI